MQSRWLFYMQFSFFTFDVRRRHMQPPTLKTQLKRFLKSPRKSIKLFAFNFIWQRSHGTALHRQRNSGAKVAQTEKMASTNDVQMQNASEKKQLTKLVEQKNENGEGGWRARDKDC